MSAKRGLPAADLANAFRPRADSEPAVPELADSEPPPPVRLASLPPRPSAAPNSAADVPARPASPAASPTSGTGRLVLWTPVAIRRRMQAVRATQGVLYRDQVLDALEATVDDLPGLLSDSGHGGEVHRGRLFERRAPVRRPSDGPRVQLTISGFLASQLVVIDDLVTSAGASSRSALINAALDEALPRL